MTAKGKTILITGSTDGVGRYIAERLAAEGWRILVHGRDRSRGEAAVERITEQGGEARFLAADFSSLAEVRALADAVQRDGEGLDALVNNAGIGTSGARRELSADGFELRFAVNYLAGFLLTRLLLPMLENRKAARIVNVSSAGQQPIDFSDVMLTCGYTGVRAYCQSKLAQILFRSISQGARRTQHYRELLTSSNLHGHGHGSPERRPADQHGRARRRGNCAARRVPALADRSGLYFSGMNQSRANPQAYDETARRACAR